MQQYQIDHYHILVVPMLGTNYFRMVQLDKIINGNKLNLGHNRKVCNQWSIYLLVMIYST